MLRIGIINNMAPAAIASTDLQFETLLSAAARGNMPEIYHYRLVGARPAHYRPTNCLQTDGLDALIITGAEPREATLPEERFWAPFIDVVEWAADHIETTILSCLASHAGVLYFDGIHRCLQAQKIFGLYESIKVTDHPLTRGLPASWRVPHSRWNDLSETDLVEHGYTVLARSRDAGVDMFTKRIRRCLFWSIQTHLEYPFRALLRQYSRDIGRWQTDLGERPHIPRNYFSESEALRLEAMTDGGVKEIDRMLRADELAEGQGGWQEIAVKSYRNWLDLINERQVVA